MSKRKIIHATLVQHPDVLLIAAPSGDSDDYEAEELRAAFSRVQHKDHWKDVVRWSGSVDAAERRLIAAAVAFMTGTEATWTELPGDRWQIDAAGYWGGPCN